MSDEIFNTSLYPLNQHLTCEWTKVFAISCINAYVIVLVFAKKNPYAHGQ